MHPELAQAIDQVLQSAGLPRPDALAAGMRLREDLRFDSFAMAELAVLLEHACGVDVFAAGLVHTIGEIDARLPPAQC
jgi:acyl carrier protein